MWNSFATLVTIVTGLYFIASFLIRLLSRHSRNRILAISMKTARATLEDFSSEVPVIYRTGKKRARSKEIFQTSMAIWINSENSIDEKDINGDEPILISLSKEDRDQLWEARLHSKPLKSSNVTLADTDQGLSLKFDFIEPGDVIFIDMVHSRENFSPRISGRFRNSNRARTMKFHEFTKPIKNAILLLRLILILSYLACSIATVTLVVMGLRAFIPEVILFSIPGENGGQGTNVTVVFPISVILGLGVFLFYDRLFLRLFGKDMIEGVLQKSSDPHSIVFQIAGVVGKGRFGVDSSQAALIIKHFDTAL